MPVKISGIDGLQVTALPYLIGQVCWFAMNTAPDGFLKAEGQAVSRTTFATLFSKIGTTYGAGNGTTTFNLPDLRGEFVRSVDNGRGVDPGRGIGSTQGDLLRNHQHEYNSSTGSTQWTGDPGSGARSTSVIGTSGVFGGLGGAETRPRNVALLACIFVGI